MLDMVVVRPASGADIAGVFDLHKASIRAFGPAGYDAAQVEAWASKEEPDYPVDEDDHVFVVAERDGELAGFGDLDLTAAEVVAVYVHPDHARQGVGSAILSHLETRARNAGLPKLGLLASKNAVDFYRRSGYERVETRIHETGGEELKCLWMEKRLD